MPCLGSACSSAGGLGGCGSGSRYSALLGNNSVWENPFPERDTSVGSSVCVALTRTVHIEKDVKTVLKNNYI